MRIDCKSTVRCLAIVTVTAGFLSLAQTRVSQPVDVILVLDNSGSMKRNDPNGLMRQAVSDFATHLRDDSQVGLVLFDQRVEPVLGLTRVSDASFRSSLSESLKRVDFSGKWTDIPGGIERAIYTLNHDGRPDALHVLVFFTDGIIETGDRAKDLERGRWLRENLTAEAKQRGIRIFGVAFTEAADYQLIQAVAQATGGEHFRVLKSSDIADAFARIGKRILEPLPVSAQLTGAGEPAAPVQVSPWAGRLVMGGTVGFGLLAIAIIVLFRRRASEAQSRSDSENVPPADFAHLTDVGGYTGTDRVPVHKRRIRIGRDAKANDICIAEETVSSQHATIEYREGCFFLRDLRSSNGTFVNGKQISDPDAVREVMVKSGDRVRFDAYEFVFNLDALAGDATPGAQDVPERRKTTLRSEPSPALQEVRQEQPDLEPNPAVGVPPPARARVPTAPVIQKLNRAPSIPAGTRVRNEFCPAHPAWKATELCPTCGVGKCKQCMTEQDGKVICTDCARHVGGRELEQR